VLPFLLPGAAQSVVTYLMVLTPPLQCRWLPCPAATDLRTPTFPLRCSPHALSAAYPFSAQLAACCDSSAILLIPPWLGPAGPTARAQHFLAFPARHPPSGGPAAIALMRAIRLRPPSRKPERLGLTRRGQGISIRAAAMLPQQGAALGGQTLARRSLKLPTPLGPIPKTVLPAAQSSCFSMTATAASRPWGWAKRGTYSRSHARPQTVTLPSPEPADGCWSSVWPGTDASRARSRA